jgi:fatty acid desaturase
LLAEHTGCPLVADMLENSRTTHTNRLVKTLAWNMPYHAEHHAYAAIPFHALPRLHEALKESIVHQSCGYLAVHRDVWRRLGLVTHDNAR